MSNQNRFFAAKSAPLVLGHRGAPSLHQENSLAGLKRALSLGADGVEFDVFLTKDGKPVVFHDEDTYRLTGQRGRITEMTWDEVSKLRMQRTVHMGKNARGEDIVITFDQEEPVTLLEEVLSEFKGKAVMDIELKPPFPNRAEREVGVRTAEVIERVGVADQVIVTSFDFFKLKAAEETRPSLQTGFAYDDNSFDSFEQFLRAVPEFPSILARAAGNQNVETVLNWLAEINAIGRFIGSSVINIEQTLVDDDTILKCHKRGMPVGVYTILPLDTAAVKHPRAEAEEIANARRLASLGVDWFETDYPDQLMQALR